MIDSKSRFFRFGTCFVAATAVTIAIAGCSDDDDDADDESTGARAGKPSAGAGGSVNPGGNGGSSDGGADGRAEGGAAPGSAGASLGGNGGDGDGGVPPIAGGAGGAEGDRHAFRPEELPFDQTAFEALTLPEGFAINVYRQGLGQARMLGVHGDHVYVTQPMEGNVVQLIDANDDGVAEAQKVVASGLPMVHGIAFHDDDVYLANVNSVYRAAIAEDGSFGSPTEIISDLPDGGQHALRTLGVGPDELLYISIGSDCDACAEANPEHATLLRSTLAGQPEGTRTIFAHGLRNTIGFGWHPTTDDLWGMDHGSDWRGDDLPPEELNAIEAGNDYGWPYCYGDRHADPIIQDPPDQTKAAYCAETSAPFLTSQAHQAPIGLAFSTSAAFPEHYQDGAFVAFHGSWNRKPATGYRVAFIPFVEGQPQTPEDFVSGFLIQNGTATFGRPAGIAIAPDGALLFTDDTNGVVYRVQAE